MLRTGPFKVRKRYRNGLWSRGIRQHQVRPPQAKPLQAKPLQAAKPCSRLFAVFPDFGNFPAKLLLFAALIQATFFISFYLHSHLKMYPFCLLRAFVLKRSAPTSDPRGTHYELLPSSYANKTYLKTVIRGRRCYFLVGTIL